MENHRHEEHPSVQGTASKTAGKDLWQRMRRLQAEMLGFDRSARGLLGLLDEENIPDAEVEAMSTPRANLLGNLECLLADDLAPALAKFGELDGLLQASVAGS